MGKRNWGRIAKWAAGVTATVVVGGCAGLNHWAEQTIAKDTQKVTDAMNLLAKAPVKLIRFADCANPRTAGACLEAYRNAEANTGYAKFLGVYDSADYGDDINRAFVACSRRHGWANCKTVSPYEVEVKGRPDIVVPAGTNDYSKAQFVWMLPGYQTVRVGVAADSKKYYLDLK